MEITSALQSEQHVKKELARKLGELQERLGELKETVRPTTCGVGHQTWGGWVQGPSQISHSLEQVSLDCSLSRSCPFIVVVLLCRALGSGWIHTHVFKCFPSPNLVTEVKR